MQAITSDENDASSLQMMHLVAARVFSAELARQRVVDGDVVTVTTDQTVPPDLMAPALE